MVYSLIGYKTLSVMQLVNVFVTFVRNLKEYDAFRLLCAYLYLEAKQEATERSLQLAGRAVKEWEGPSVAELRKLVGGRKSIAALKQSLVDLQLVSLSGKRLTITETPLADSRVFLKLICGADQWGGFVRSIVRPVPIPHEWFLVWAKPARAKLDALLHLFYAAACLSFRDKQSNQVKVAATFKLEQLVLATSLNRSRFTDARRRLIDQQRISPDSTRHQRKLNRDGHYAAINLEWGRSEQRTTVPNAQLGRQQTKKCSETGQPYRDIKQASLVGRNQKGSGASLEAITASPTPDNVRREDLLSAERLHELFKKQTWLPKSKANFQFFVTSAVKARTQGEHPERLFVWLVAGRRKDYVSLKHEQIALQEIAVLRERSQRHRRRERTEVEPSLSPEAILPTKERIAVQELVQQSLADSSARNAA